MGTVLLVDDDAGIRSGYGRILGRAGHTVATAESGDQALVQLGARSFDAILSDVSMPRLGGIELLRAVRERDSDVPVLLMTGGSALKAAARAVEYGASRFLVKPVMAEVLVDAIERAMRLHRLAKVKREAHAVLGTGGERVADRATTELRFRRALGTLWVAFQPIVSWRARRVYGYEALMRSEEPMLARPDLLLEAAERLGRVHELGRTVRRALAAAAANAPDGTRLFLNLHAEDLRDEDLYLRSSPLTRFAERVVLEITERASLDSVEDVRARVASLRALGFRVAVDDLGTGYAGLASFALLEPEVVKLDMSLARDVDTQPIKQGVVRSMARLCRELGMAVITEGIETAAERDALALLGCDLLQGYLFARPGRGFVAPLFP
jgi:EAL domain-containing protein (putative c-di-GMP-specific phosphodiesterase class I)/CheY-like chemotaxis protein